MFGFGKSKKTSGGTRGVKASGSLIDTIRRMLYDGGDTGSKNPLSNVSFYACVNLISSSLALLPIRITDGDGNEIQSLRPLASAINRQPNQDMTAYLWRFAQNANLLIHGNSYDFIMRDASGGVAGLVPISPTSVRKYRDKDSSVVLFEVSMGNGSKQIYNTTQIMHRMNFTLDGFIGMSVLEHHAMVIGISIDGQKVNSKVLKKGLSFPGVLSHPGVLTDEPMARRIRESFQDAISGDNAGNVPLLEEGMTFTPIGMSMRDGQFLELMGYHGEEVARIFNLQPHKIGLMDNATFSNIEQQNREYVSDTLMPHAINFEQAIASSLMTRQQAQGARVSFDFTELLRGDLAARTSHYQFMVRNGILNANDILSLEGLPIRMDDAANDYLVARELTPEVNNDG